MNSRNNGNGNGSGLEHRWARLNSAIEMSRRRYAGADSLIYFGNLPAAYPAILLRDPYLRPAQMVLYLILHQQFQTRPEVGNGVCNALLPDPVTIKARLKIDSRTTVAFCFKMLRATRWLSLVDPQIRDPRGRYTSNLYALHGEPCSLEEAIYLDRGYLALVESLAHEGGRRARKTGQAILAAIETLLAHREFDVAVGSAVATEPKPYSLPNLEQQETRLAALAAADTYERGAPKEYKADPQAFYACQLLDSLPTDSATMAENSPDSGEKAPHDSVSKKWTRFENTKTGPCPKNGHGENGAHRDQNLDTVPNFEHGSNSGHGSSSSFLDNNNIKNITTTTPPYSPPPPPSSAAEETGKPIETTEPSFDWSALVFPESFSEPERVVARNRLREAKPELRQPILDELAGRIRTKERVGQRIHDPIAYLRRLITLANQGELVLSSSAMQIQTGRTLEKDREEDLKRYEQDSLAKLNAQADRLAQRNQGEGE